MLTERLRKRGYETLLTYYEKVAPSRVLGKPLYRFPKGRIVARVLLVPTFSEYSGVRSIPVGYMLTGHLLDYATYFVHFLFTQRIRRKKDECSNY